MLMEAVRGKNTKASAHFGTLSQCLVHPTAPFLVFNITGINVLCMSSKAKKIYNLKPQNPSYINGHGQP